MLVEESRSFGIAPTTRSKHLARSYFVTTTPLRLSNRDPNRIDPRNVIIDVDFEEIEEMVEDDEWIGFTVQLSQAVREVVMEALDTMKDDMYKAEKVTKQVDARIKAEVARWRGKESYEIGDFVKAISEACQTIIEDVTGSKPMKQLGEFTTKVDTKVKKAAADFCHKDEYSPGDVTKEIAGRVKKGVLEFTGKPTYQIGDISREIRNRREQWIKENLEKDPHHHVITCQESRKKEVC